MRSWSNGSWRTAVGLGLLVPALAVSASFTFERPSPRPAPAAPSSLVLASSPQISTFPPSLTSAFQAPAPAPAISPAVVAASSPPAVPAPRREGTGPLIALQAGHWLSAEVPSELRDLRYNGTVANGKPEWEVTLEIAQATAKLLEAQGYSVEILPTTIPPSYEADLFISIHADGYNDPNVSGFTIGAPRRDATRRAAQFVEVLAETYAEATDLRRRTNVTRRMQNYYAFNSRRYDHALHPMTVAVILETGFLTSPADRRVIVDNQDLSARGISEAVARFVPFPTPEAPAEEGTTAAVR